MAANRTGQHAPSVVVRIIACMAIALAYLPFTALPAQAAANLTISPITWNVIGLDSNNVNTGPSAFASGARVCNTGSSAATNVVANYVWDSSNSYVGLSGPSSLSVASLNASACTDFYFNVSVTRNSAAYDTARGYHITASADGTGAVSTPTPRELYIEHLVSQNRNNVTAITGPGGIGDPAPTTVYVGSTYTYKLYASTATQGYEQLSSFLNFPNTIFQITSVSSTYSAPAGATNDKIYADACGWENNPSSSNYRSCVGPVQYSGGKAGGSSVITTYQVKILSAGSATLTSLIYDFSGSSFHYNSDYGVGVNSVSVTALDPPADLSITKSDSPNTVIAGQDVTYTLNATNNGPGDATGVAISDPVPTGTTFQSASNGGVESGGTVTWNIGNLANGASVTRTLVVTVDSSLRSDLSNTASVSGNQTDPTPGNNSDTEATTVTAEADVSIAKSDSPDPVLAGADLTYTLTASNAGPSDATGVTVTDTLPASVTYVSASPSQGSCSRSAQTVTCALGTIAPSGSATVDIVVTPTAAGALSNSASVSATETDPTPGNNTDAESTTVDPAADLSISKTDSPDPVRVGQDLFYTLTASNAGPSDATGVTVTDTLPAGATFGSATPSQGSCSRSGLVLTCSLGAISASGSATVTVVVTPNAGSEGSISNSASVSGDQGDPDPGNDSTTEDTTVDGSSDLAVAIDDGVGSVTAGSSTTYTVTLSNGGPSTVPAGAVVQVPVPAGTTASEAEADCAISGGTLTCTTSAALVSSDSVVWSFTLDLDPGYPGGTLDATATITSSPNVDPVSGNDEDTDSDTVSRSTDLSISISDAPDPVTVGDTITYSASVANGGISDAAGVTATVDLPAGVSFSSAIPSQGTCFESGGTLTCSLGSLAAGASATISADVVPQAGSEGTATADASVDGDEPDPNAVNDSDSTDTLVLASADLGVSVSDSPDPVTVGSDVSYTVDVTDDGPSDATGVTATIDLPAGVAFVSATPTQGSCTESGGVVTCALGAIASGGSATVAVVVNPPTAGVLTLDASVDGAEPDPNTANDADSEATTVEDSADLGVSISDAPDPVTAGDDVTYTVGVSNDGPSDATGVTATIDLPAGVTFGSATSSQGTCSEAGGTVTCVLGTIANGGTATISVVVSTGSDGLLTANASLAGNEPDPNAANDSDSTTTQVDPLPSADLGVSISDSPDPVSVGSDVTYTAVVASDGPSDATGVGSAIDLPAGVTFVSATPSQGTCAEAGALVTCDLGALNAGDGATIAVVVTADPGSEGIITLDASVAGDQADPNAANDADSEDTIVLASADLGVSVSDAPDPVSVGDDVAYTIDATNDGPSDATGVSATIDLPGGTTYVSATPTQGSCSESGGLVTCNLGDLASGGTATVAVVVTADPGSEGIVTLDASVDGNEPDPNPANDDDSEDTTVLASANLGVSVSDSPDPVSVGDDVTYTIDVSNDGPSDATGVSATIDLPAGTSYVSATPTQGTCSEAFGTVTCDLGDLASGGSATVTVVVTADPGSEGTITLTAGVNGNEPDPNAANDSDSEDTTVEGSADLAVTIDDGVSTVTEGTSTTYAITLANGGPSAVPAGAKVEVPVPAGVTPSESEADCAIAAGVLTCTTFASLASGDAVTWQLTLDVPNGYGSGTLDVTASIASSPVADPNAGNDQDVDSDGVMVPGTGADLSIAKSDSLDPATPGAAFDYTLTVENAGPDASTNVHVDDAVPSGLSVSGVSSPLGTCSATGNDVGCDLGSLASGSSWEITVSVVVDTDNAGGDLVNTATVASDDDPTPGNDEVSETTTVTPVADLSITKDGSPVSVAAGERVTYTITVANAGPATAADVVVTDPLPAGTTFVSADGGGTESGGEITWNLGDLADGDSVTLTLVLEVDPGWRADIDNTATVSSSTVDLNLGNDEATASTDVSAEVDLAVGQTDSPDPVTVGNDVSYTITVTDQGPSDATSIALTDLLPAGVTFVSATPSQGTCGESGGVLTCDLGDLAAGDSLSIDLVVTAEPGSEGSISNVATALAAEPETDETDNESTETTVVLGQADLSVDISDSPDPVGVGEELSYSVVVGNAGPSSSTGTTLAVDLPAGVAFVSATPTQGTCSQAGGTVTCDLGIVPAGGSASVTIVVVPQPGSEGSVTADTVVSGDRTDPVPGNDSDSEDTTVESRADLSLSKSVSADPGTVGEDLTYTLAVANDGPSDATGVSVTDALPAGVTFVSATPPQGTCDEAAGTVTCVLGTLAAGATATVDIVVTPTAAGTLVNTADVGGDQPDPDPTDDGDTVVSSVDPAPAQADLSITKSGEPDPVTVGNDLTYTITVTDNGPDDATGVNVTDPLPAGVTFVSATPSQGTCGESAGVVTCDLGDLADGASATVVLVVTPQAGSEGLLVNTAAVAGDQTDPDPSDDEATDAADVLGEADLSVTKTGSPDPVVAGEDLTYTLTVANDGPSDATGVVVSDPLPAGVTFVSATPTQGTCDEAAGTVTCDLGSLAAGATATVSIVVTASDTGTLSNTASVSGDQPDPDNSNDEAMARVEVTAAADLSISKNDDADPVVVGDPLTYTITVTNHGPSDATGVLVQDPLPAGLEFDTATPSQGSCDESGGVVSCDLGDLANGDQATVRVAVTPAADAAGTVLNTATVSSDVIDPDASNDEDTQSTRVTGAADLSIAKTTEATNVAAGEDLLYDLVVTNSGPGDAHDVTVTDTLEIGVDYVSAVPEQGSCSLGGRVVRCDLGTVPNGGRVGIVLTVVPMGGTEGELPNTASVAGAEPDPNVGNESSTVSVAVSDSADLEVAKRADARRFAEGDIVTYTVTVTNHGPSDASGVVVRDVLPQGLTGVGAHASRGTYHPRTGRWDVGNLADGASATLVVRAKVSAGTAGSDIVNHASIAASDQPDPVSANNAHSAGVSVRTPADPGDGGNGGNGGKGGNGDEVAFTGADVFRLGALALTLAAIGVALVLAARRRRNEACSARR